MPELAMNDVSEKGDESEESEGGGCEESAVKEIVAAPKTVKSLSDLWLVENGGKSKRREEAHCSSCGALGHKWPKCRARNIELMLVNIGAMPSEPVPHPQPRLSQAAKIAEPSLMREVMELPNIEPMVEKNVEKSRKAKKRGKVVTCTHCKGEALHESWRLFGMRCSACQDCFVHYVCTETKVWTCDVCQACLSLAK